MNRARLTAPILVIVVIAAVAAVIVATESGSTKTSTSASSAVTLRQTSLGSVLADANGRTLYLFEADRPNVSTLSVAGRAIWPPFTAKAKPTALGGVDAALIGTIPGSGQVTYDGHPVYYYVGDQTPGQTTGQGLNQFGARWYALSAAGRAITSTLKTPNNPSTLGY